MNVIRQFVQTVMGNPPLENEIEREIEGFRAETRQAEERHRRAGEELRRSVGKSLQLVEALDRGGRYGPGPH
jgi:hypothetical protein